VPFDFIIPGRKVWDMKRTASAIALGYLMVCGGVVTASAQTEVQVVPPPAADVKVYGEYPIAYQAIITRWLETRLIDPLSAVVDWAEPPKAGEVPGPKGSTQRFVGYLVDFKVNARNQFGAATGKRKYRVVIRNGEVLWGGHPR